MKYKYIILDFGNVIVTPTTGDWHMTPKFKELIDVNIATISSIYNTKNYVIVDVKNDFTEELDNFIEEKSFYPYSRGTCGGDDVTIYVFKATKKWTFQIKFDTETIKVIVN